MFIRVVLPAPFSPRRARISPRLRSRSIPLLATRGPKRLVTPWMERTRGAEAFIGIEEARSPPPCGEGLGVGVPGVQRGGDGGARRLGLLRGASAPRRRPSPPAPLRKGEGKR